MRRLRAPARTLTKVSAAVYASLQKRGVPPDLITSAMSEIKTILTDPMLGVAMSGRGCLQHLAAAEECLKYIENLYTTTSARRTRLPSKNVREDFFSHWHPDMKNNNSFKKLCSALLRVTKKGVGQGEVLLCVADPNFAWAASTRADLLYGNRTLCEVKSVSNKASIKANQNASFRVADQALHDRVFGKKLKIKQIAKAPHDQQHKFFEALHPEFYDFNRYDDIFKQVDRAAALGGRQPERKLKDLIGFEILKNYKKLEDFQNLICFRKKGNSIEFVNIVDFDDSAFISENIKFSLQVWRGGGAQAVGDGYADIELYA